MTSWMAQAHARSALSLPSACARASPRPTSLNEAWLGPHRFYVDERVIVPRSFIAELINRGQTPILPPSRKIGASLSRGQIVRFRSLHRLRLPRDPCGARISAGEVDAADLSGDALEVAKRNVADYKLGKRVRLVKSDLFSALEGRKYDLIISNPPYVKAASMGKLPEEYRKEPEMALASGSDGLDHTRTILARGREHLNPGGRLVVEIGHNRKALEKAYPKLPFEWPKTSSGTGFVFVLDREQLG